MSSQKTFCVSSSATYNPPISQEESKGKKAVFSDSSTAPFDKLLIFLQPWYLSSFSSLKATFPVPLYFLCLRLYFPTVFLFVAFSPASLTCLWSPSIPSSIVLRPFLSVCRGLLPSFNPSHLLPVLPFPSKATALARPFSSQPFLLALRCLVPSLGDWWSSAKPGRSDLNTVECPSAFAEPKNRVRAAHMCQLSNADGRRFFHRSKLVLHLDRIYLVFLEYISSLSLFGCPHCSSKWTWSLLICGLPFHDSFLEPEFSNMLTRE